MEEPTPPKRKEFEQFRDLTKRVIAVPKRDIDRREDEYRTQRAKKKRKLKQVFT